MHEMSVALSIVKIAETEAKKANVQEFSAIDLEIGTLAGIEFDSLNFVWDSAVKDTVLEKATKRIMKIPAKARCEDCAEIYDIEFIHENCPSCDSFRKRITQGKELRIKSLELTI